MRTDNGQEEEPEEDRRSRGAGGEGTKRFKNFKSRVVKCDRSHDTLLRITHA